MKHTRPSLAKLVQGLWVSKNTLIRLMDKTRKNSSKTQQRAIPLYCHFFVVLRIVGAFWANRFSLK